MAYVFEWDAKKADANVRKHGVNVEEATTVFGDPLAILMLDPDHGVSTHEVSSPRHVEPPSTARRVVCGAFQPHAANLGAAREPARAEEV